MPTFTPIPPDVEMRIKSKNLNTSSMELAKDGIELEFRPAEQKEHTGDLIITPTRITWNRGKKSTTGKSINWPQFFKLMNSQR